MSPAEHLPRVCVALAFYAMLSRTALAGDELGVSLANLESAGAFEVVNTGPHVELSSRVMVQRRDHGVWSGVMTDVRLVAACGEAPPAGSCVTIEAGATLRPPPWNGSSCGGQCVADCRANALAGPGEYRFAARTCDGATTIYGPPFRWP